MGKQMRGSEFMEKYSVGRTKFYELMRTKGFPSTKIGKDWRVDEEKFLKWQEIEFIKSYE